MKGGWVYIMTNAAHSTLYIGVTAHLAARIMQHREGRGSEFCREHGLVRLVWVERHEDIHEAIVREKRIKDWHRQWKLRLIRKANPYWRDLFGDINALSLPSPRRRPGPNQPLANDHIAYLIPRLVRLV